MIPQETVDAILDSAQVAEVVSDYVTLKRRGANFVACCPFHNEKTPSFYVSPSKGIYKCFGCGKSGTAVGFVMEQEHCSYTDALRYLARKYHIEIQEKEESPEELLQKQRKESLLLVSEFACKFYASNLRSGEGQSVGYAYFRNRGLEDETIEKFALGWAPGGRTALIDAATRAGYKMEYLLAAGLVVQKEDGTVVDKFRERAMFPVHSVSGRVVAFSGRTLRSDNPAKYVNSPETEIYVKSRNLLGIYFAKAEISRLKKCILVEGNVDMVMMHQLGIRNVVASCGTSLTVEQIRLIHRFTEDVTIMYDGDSAGIHAAIRGLDLVLAEGLNVKVVLLPEGEDPDSFCRKHTLDEVLSYIESGEKDFIVFKTELLLGQKDVASDPLRKANLINDIADSIARIPDAVKRSVYVDATARRFDIDSQILFQRITSDRRKPQGPVAAATVENEPQQTWIPENATLAQAEEDILYFLLMYGENPLEFESDSEFYTGDSAPGQTVAEFIRSSFSDGTSMVNSVYVRIFEEYFRLHDGGVSGAQILKSLLNSPDRQMADVCAGITTRKYQLTVDRFENSLTAVSSWLVLFVPKSIMVYAQKRIQDRIQALRRMLPDAGTEDEGQILKEIVKLQAASRRVKQKIGRDKLIDNG